MEKIISPEELDQENSIRSIGIPVETFWQSSMIEPTQLPFSLKNMPDIFTDFRKLIEAKKHLEELLAKKPDYNPKAKALLDMINKKLSTSSDE